LITSDGAGDTIVSGGDGDILGGPYAFQAFAVLVGGPGAETLSGLPSITSGTGYGNDVIFGGSGPDQIFAGSLSNTVIAGTGDDTISAQGPQTTVWAGAGADSISLQSGGTVYGSTG